MELETKWQVKSCSSSDQNQAIHVPGPATSGRLTSSPAIHTHLQHKINYLFTLEQPMDKGSSQSFTAC